MADRNQRLQQSRVQSKHFRIARCILPSVVFCLNAGTSDALANKLQPATVQAWNRYVQWADKRVQRELSDPGAFLVEDFFPAAERAAVKRDLAADKIVVRHMTSPVPKGERFQIRNGEIHHWWGAVLVPGVKLPVLLSFLQDYENHAGKFADVERSRLISRDGNLFRFFFRLKRSKAFVTAIYNTEQECLYTSHTATRESSRSEATRIVEVEDPGKPSEHELPPGEDRGFLWRLVSWWRFEQTDRGVIIEVESASLSRDIPAIVDFIPWLRSYIRSTPKDSIESILGTIRNYGKALK
ncbi:MAG TPA: hypothetical protein VE398_06405 [Acidobacteriota bacterium]|nr:hypothetical protein [Acidobacteriota bacterium]